MEEKLEIPKRTGICAARHIVAAHESVCKEKPVEWSKPCVGCSELHACSLPNGVIDWTENLQPIFEATGIYPQLCGYDSPTAAG